MGNPTIDSAVDAIREILQAVDQEARESGSNAAWEDRGNHPEPKWIVNDIGELGVLVGRRAFFLYKGDSLEYTDPRHDDGTETMYRLVGKREFGETCQPPGFWDSEGKCKYPGRYTVGDTWRPLRDLRDATP